MYCSQTPRPAEPWFINTVVPAQKTLMVASLDEAEYALLDSGSGLTSCPINYADDLPLLPRPTNLPNFLATPLEAAWNALVKDKSGIGLRMVNRLL